MNTRVLISYKWRSDRADTHWLFWLQKKLEAQGFQVILSPLRNISPGAQWVSDIQSLYNIHDHRVHTVQHDPGCLTILNYLEYLASQDIQETVLLVAGTPSQTHSLSNSYIRLEGPKEIAIFQPGKGERSQELPFDPTLVILYSADPQALPGSEYKKLI